MSVQEYLNQHGLSSCLDEQPPAYWQAMNALYTEIAQEDDSDQLLTMLAQCGQWLKQAKLLNATRLQQLFEVYQLTWCQSALQLLSDKALLAAAPVDMLLSRNEAPLFRTIWGQLKTLKLINPTTLQALEKDEPEKNLCRLALTTALVTYGVSLTSFHNQAWSFPFPDALTLLLDCSHAAKQPIEPSFFASAEFFTQPLVNTLLLFADNATLTLKNLHTLATANQPISVKIEKLIALIQRYPSSADRTTEIAYLSAFNAKEQWVNAAVNYFERQALLATTLTKFKETMSELSTYQEKGLSAVSSKLIYDVAAQWLLRQHVMPDDLAALLSKVTISLQDMPDQALNKVRRMLFESEGHRLYNEETLRLERRFFPASTSTLPLALAPEPEPQTAPSSLG